ncbi:MAG: ComF family protein, partial [Bacteroidales bacterium]|nr:ComF family protein [Bacteroidales bacterium]
MDDLPLTYNWSYPSNDLEERLWKIGCGIEGAASLFFYRHEGGYSHIVHRFKFDGDMSLGRHFARELAAKLVESNRFSAIQAVVPVPLHPLRRWKRGFNQSEIIAGA